MFTCSKQIGNIKFIIDSDIPVDMECFPQKLPYSTNEKDVSLILRTDMSNRLAIAEKFIEGEQYLPKSFLEEDMVLRKNNYLHRGINNKYNSFTINKDVVLGYFPYKYDDFYISYRPNEREITIYGTEYNLNRIMIDIISMCQGLLPVHCSCITYNGRGIVFLGTSGSGKSLMADYYIKKGAKYIADDCCLINGNAAYRVQNSISVRHQSNKDEKNQHLLTDFKETIKYDNTTDVDDVFILETSDKQSFIKRYKNSMFPTITRESVWCFDAIGLEGFYDRIFLNSVKITDNLINRAKLFDIEQYK